MEMAKEMNTAQLEARLTHHYGSESFFHGFNKNSVYTDGIKEFIELAGCYWLYDIIQTEVFDVLRKQTELDTYTFNIFSWDTQATLKVSDYKGRVIWRRNIEFTDFPKGQFNLVVGWDGHRLTTCLKAEN